MRVKHITGFIYNGAPKLLVRVDGRLKIIHLAMIQILDPFLIRKSVSQQSEL